MSNQVNIPTNAVKYTALIIFGLVLLALSLTTIDAGYRGVRLRNGAAVGQVGDGLNFKIPFIEKIVRFEVRTQKEQVVAKSASKDLQDITATVALNYSVKEDRVIDLYKQLGVNYKDRVIQPRINEAVKTVTARFTAEEIITKRQELKQQIVDELIGKVDEGFFNFEDAIIVNVEFSPEFTRAIEQKQLAQQQAFKAENDLKRIQVEAQQQIEKAKADAEAQRLQQQTLTKDLLQKMAIEKWDGKMPLVTDGGNTILDLNSLKQ